MKITFEGEDLQHVVASIGKFLYDLTKNDHTLGAAEPPKSVGPTSSPTGDQTEKSAKSTRTTRKRSQPSSKAESDGEEKPTRRRRARSTDSPAETSTEPAKGRRRRASAASSSEEDKPKRTRRTKKAADDELKDMDLSKAASGLADATNPKVVLDLLEEFGVTKVGELEGDARREFLDAVAELIADEGPSA